MEAATVRCRSGCAERGPVTRRRAGLLAMAAVVLVLPACADDCQFTLLGYTTKPNYDTHIRTVYVPIFKNRTFWKDMEFELTEAVVREINAKTPYKVISNRAAADTELTGTIVSFNKGILNVDQLGEQREVQTTLGVEVVWKDLRTGEVLSRPRPPGATPPVAPTIPAVGVPGVEVQPLPFPAPPPPPPPPGTAPPVLIQSLGDYIPELGGSITTARQQNVDRLAIQIVSMMESPW